MFYSHMIDFTGVIFFCLIHRHKHFELGIIHDKSTSPDKITDIYQACSCSYSISNP